MTCTQPQRAPIGPVNKHPLPVRRGTTSTTSIYDCRGFGVLDLVTSQCLHLQHLGIQRRSRHSVVHYTLRWASNRQHWESLLMSIMTTLCLLIWPYIFTQVTPETHLISSSLEAPVLSNALLLSYHGVITLPNIKSRSKKHMLYLYRTHTSTFILNRGKSMLRLVAQ